MTVSTNLNLIKIRNMFYSETYSTHFGSERMVEELLQKFDFCLDYGFVIKDPLQRLDSYFDPWTELVLQLDDIR